jgi:hypothetical protein
MRGAQELIWGLVRMALIAAGVFYAVQVLVSYARHESHERPDFDAKDRLRSAERLLVWAGVMTVWVIGRLIRPVVSMLSEASAEVGEWAISRRQAQAAMRSRLK